MVLRRVQDSPEYLKELYPVKRRRIGQDTQFSQPLGTAETNHPTHPLQPTQQLLSQQPPLRRMEVEDYQNLLNSAPYRMVESNDWNDGDSRGPQFIGDGQVMQSSNFSNPPNASIPVDPVQWFSGGAPLKHLPLPRQVCCPSLLDHCSHPVL